MTAQPATNVGFSTPKGALGLRVLPRHWPVADNWPTVIEHSTPQKGLPDEVNDWRSANAKNFIRSMRAFAAARAALKLGVRPLYGALWLRKFDSVGNQLDLGLAGLRVVTDVGVGYIVDAFQNTTELENMKFHGFGTGSNAEAAANTALHTELTTQYVSDVRPTGTTTEGASANIYRTVATLSPDSGGTINVTEHGIFSASTGGVLLDKTLFTAVPIVASADSLQATYDLTFPSGG